MNSNSAYTHTPEFTPKSVRRTVKNLSLLEWSSLETPEDGQGSAELCRWLLTGPPPEGSTTVTLEKT